MKNNFPTSATDVHNYPFLVYMLLCLGMVMYDNEFETKENKI